MFFVTVVCEEKKFEKHWYRGCF